jgi:hypothetical protein
VAYTATVRSLSATATLTIYMLRFVPAKNAGDEIGCGGKGRLRLIALRRVAAFRQHQRFRPWHLAANRHDRTGYDLATLTGPTR